MSPKVSLVIATTNAKKIEEFRHLFKSFPVEIVDLKSFPNIKEVEETGSTFEENAALKALGYAAQTGKLTLGEDSGLCCDALEGAPGVYSARFSGAHGSDDANNEKVLRLFEKIPDNCRGAHYKSAITLAEPGKIIGTVSGQVHGVIAKELSGNQGFGYDPLFFYLPFQKTFGEVPAEMKHKVSHRAKAFEKVCGLLGDYLKLKF